MIERDVFHIRLKNMELQAERIMDPVLKTRPVAIISSHHPGGTVVSLSPEAEDEGLFPGMKVSVVRKISHGVQLLPYNRSLYARINQYVYQTVSMFTPVVEPQGVGDFFLKITDKGIAAHNKISTMDPETEDPVQYFYDLLSGVLLDDDSKDIDN